MAFGLLVSPLLSGAIFIVGAIAWVLLATLRSNQEEGPSAGGTEAHTAARMREEGRNASHR